MRFVLNYAVDDVLITLSVEANTPEEGESKMKKCVSKMLRNFPVGMLFGQLQDIFNTPPQPLEFPQGQWQGNTPNWGQGALGGNGTVTIDNTGPYVVTIGGSVIHNADGSIHFTNLVTSSGILTSNAGGFQAPQNGSFTFTASGGPNASSPVFSSAGPSSGSSY